MKAKYCVFCRFSIAISKSDKTVTCIKWNTNTVVRLDSVCMGFKPIIVRRKS